jgi:hypothetical protein
MLRYPNSVHEAPEQREERVRILAGFDLDFRRLMRIGLEGIGELGMVLAEPVREVPADAHVGTELLAVWSGVGHHVSDVREPAP